MHHQLPRLLMKNYTYLVFDSDSREALIIDPTWEMARIEDALATHSLTLKTILITHGHPDHVHLVEPLLEKHDCDVWMSATEASSFSFQFKNLRRISSETPFVAAHMTVVPWATPGHTMGCTCYQIENNLFTGDTLFIEGCGMCFGGNSDPRLLFRSLRRLKTSIPPDTCVYPAHSFGIDPGQEFSFLLRFNTYLQFENEDDFVTYRMRQGQTRLFDFK